MPILEVLGRPIPHEITTPNYVQAELAQIPHRALRSLVIIIIYVPEITSSAKDYNMVLALE